MAEWDEPHCDNSGLCVAWISDREQGYSNCFYCGKQLELIDGDWWTWDVADEVRAGDRSNAQPQQEDYHGEEI